MTDDLYWQSKHKLEIISCFELFVVVFPFLKGLAVLFYLDRWGSFPSTYKGLQQIWESPTLAIHRWFLLNQLWLLPTYLLCFSGNHLFHLTSPKSTVLVYGLLISHKIRGSFPIDNFVYLLNSSHSEYVHLLLHFVCRIL